MTTVKAFRSGAWILPAIAAAAAITMVLLMGAGSVVAAPPAGPVWSINSVALPTNFAKEDSEDCNSKTNCDSYFVRITNVGNASSSEAEPVIARDVLPEGIVIAEGNDPLKKRLFPNNVGGEVTCPNVAGASSFTCEYSGGSIPPGGTITISEEVVVTPAVHAASVTNFAEVEGGGAPRAVTSWPGTAPNTVDAAAPPAFGVQDFSVGVLGADGMPDIQAGDHPVSIVTTIDYTTTLERGLTKGASAEYAATQEPKTEIVDLPLGLVGDPLAAGECSQAALHGINLKPEQCPAGSQVGAVLVGAGRSGTEYKALYNMVPEPRYPAEFGFEFDETLFYLRASVVPSEQGYALRVTVPDIGRARPLKVTGATVLFFGDPTQVDGAGDGEAFLTNPDACGAPPLEAKLEMDSWVQPERWVEAKTPAYGGLGQGVAGCDALQFEPSIEAHPEQSTVDTPSGYEVDLKVPQERNVPGLLATPDLKNAVVSLPEGVAVSPSAANGLGACRETGPEGINITHGWTPTGAQPLDPADPEAMEIGEDELPHVAPGHCPADSQVGEVEVSTPLLASPLKGHVYIAQPQCGGEGQEQCSQADAADGKLFGIYLEVAGSGVIVKLKGDVSVNPQTGQVSTSFLENPQLPFSELKLKLDGGARAPLANPQTCGTFTATSDLTPWSAPETPDASPFASFAIAGCGSTTPFAPSFSAGTVSPTAGAYSPFTLTFSRKDGEQDLSGLTVTMPEGLLGKIAGFAQCGEAEVEAAEANTGTCPAASRVGTAAAAAGAGSEPFWQSGPVYLTGPYDGGSFGLAVVVPADAGPYRLGNIVVRAAIHINPTTAQVTVVSNPLPQMIDGVPLRVQTVNVTVGEGDDFTFNPTSCEGKAVTATISSSAGTSANVSSPFQAQGCADMPFKPVLSASTKGKASRKGGASFDVKITSGAGQANIAKVDLQLPKQLPSRLSTLKEACLAEVFDANPAACPAVSNVGSAIVHTPVLNSPLEGPVYIVSHGGAAFPDVEIVLQGEGVQIVLDGATQIKKHITYSRFEAVPDAPFTSFEVKLPTGDSSIFAANLPGKDDFDFCGKSLSMPTTITGQNGAVLKESSKVKVEGCAKAKTSSRQKKKAKTKTKAKAKKTKRKVKSSGRSS